MAHPLPTFTPNRQHQERRCSVFVLLLAFSASGCALGGDPDSVASNTNTIESSDCTIDINSLVGDKTENIIPGALELIEYKTDGRLLAKTIRDLANSCPRSVKTFNNDGTTERLTLYLDDGRIFRHSVYDYTTDLVLENEFEYDNNNAVERETLKQLSDEFVYSVEIYGRVSWDGEINHRNVESGVRKLHSERFFSDGTRCHDRERGKDGCLKERSTLHWYDEHGRIAGRKTFKQNERPNLDERFYYREGTSGDAPWHDLIRSTGHFSNVVTQNEIFSSFETIYTGPNADLPLRETGRYIIARDKNNAIANVARHGTALRYPQPGYENHWERTFYRNGIPTHTKVFLENLFPDEISPDNDGAPITRIEH